jgi:hypothetical protein
VMQNGSNKSVLELNARYVRLPGRRTPSAGRQIYSGRTDKTEQHVDGGTNLRLGCPLFLHDLELRISKSDGSETAKMNARCRVRLLVDISPSPRQHIYSDSMAGQ